MKYMYFGNATHKGRRIRGVVVYNEKRKAILKRGNYIIDESSNKLLEMLRTMIFALRAFSTGNEDLIGKDDKLIINVQSGIYEWLRTGRAPKEYINEINKIMVELSCLPCSAEIIKSNNKIDIKKYIKFEDIMKEEYSSISDMLKIAQEV